MTSSITSGALTFELINILGYEEPDPTSGSYGPLITSTRPFPSLDFGSDPSPTLVVVDVCTEFTSLHYLEIITFSYA